MVDSENGIALLQLTFGKKHVTSTLFRDLVATLIQDRQTTGRTLMPGQKEEGGTRMSAWLKRMTGNDTGLSDGRRGKDRSKERKVYNDQRA